MITMLRTALILGVTALLAGGCTGGPDSSSAPPATGDATTGTATRTEVHPAIPERYHNRTKTFPNYRRIDACGMHDLEAAKQASGGDGGDEIMPSQNSLGECSLLLSKREFHGTWTLRIEVGEAYESDRRQAATPEIVAGQPGFLEKGQDDTSCVLHRPLDDEFATRLAVRFSGTKEEQPKPACAFARDYIAASAPRWTDPPQRDSGRTSPALSLALMDPCDAASAVLDDFEPDTELYPAGPYQCVVQGPGGSPAKKKGDKTAKNPKDPKAGKGGGNDGITITYEMDEDPVLLTTLKGTSSDHAKITVGTYTGVTHTTKVKCSTKVIWDPDTSVIANARAQVATPSYQLIDIGSGSCDDAQPVAEKVMAKVGRR